MRTPTHRFWPCIAAAVAVSVIAVPAASAGVHKYDTEVTMTWETRWAGGGHLHGFVKSEVGNKTGVDNVATRGFAPANKCERGRRVALFERRPGADRELAVRRTGGASQRGRWEMRLPDMTLHWGDRVYAQVEREVLKDGDVCRGDRSPTKTYHR